MSKKRYDRNGRIRNKVVAFRMSEEENQMLDRKVALSGLTKQDYIIGCILDKEITVYGNPYVFRSLHIELVRFVKMYGTPIQYEDEEMMIWVLKMIIAMLKEDGVLPERMEKNAEASFARIKEILEKWKAEQQKSEVQGEH